jgi:hypothetical protein
MSKQSTGWSAFGYRFASLDALTDAFAVRLGAAGSDEHSVFVHVTPEPVRPSPIAPDVTTFMRVENGGRRRRFDIAGFVVHVEPHADDEEQARFTERLAVLAAWGAPT